MSKGSLLCALVLLQACFVVRSSLIASSRLTGGQIGDNFLCQDPIRGSRLMPSRGRDEFDGAEADPISDGELSGDEYASDDGGVFVEGDEADAEEEELLPLGADDGGAKDKSSGEKGSGGDVECPECGKLFKNDKSMFGHLRSHPNRGYKGATPPVKKLKLKLSPDSDAASPAPTSPGSDRPVTRYSQRDPQLTAFEMLCACVMLTLRYRDRQEIQQAPPPVSERKFNAMEQAEGVSERKLDAIEQDGGGIGGPGTSNAAAGVKSNNAGPQADNAVLCDEHGGTVAIVPKKRRSMPKQVSEAHKKVKLVTATKEKQKRPYICKHCKAEFPTYQALGGHMAGHQREKRVPALKEKETRQGMVAQGQNGKQAKGGDEPWRDGLSLSSRRLQAEELSMALNVERQSGQASGGHMRQHVGRRNDGSSSMAPLPTADGDRRRLLNIGLNVEAPEQE
ncbi:uncharacterized protein LOC133910603 [Phragmites australis]|uniref:uncharacterized protein LOC133910603 n=1 Tax=Phragmites australis TaxID=29695 RepID=UPI002D77D885|nr:uncharacterized protein LOC133910603 [Phragmites australis]